MVVAVVVVVEEVIVEEMVVEGVVVEEVVVMVKIKREEVVVEAVSKIMIRMLSQATGVEFQILETTEIWQQTTLPTYL